MARIEENVEIKCSAYRIFTYLTGAKTRLLDRLGFAWLGYRCNKKRLATIMLRSMSFSLFFLGYVSANTLWLLIPFLVLSGVGQGGSVTMLQA